MGMKRWGCESYEMVITESCTKDGPFFRHRRRHKKIKRVMFHMSSLCSLRAVPSPPPLRVLQTVRYSVFSFNFQYLLIFLRSFSSCLRPLPRLSFLSIFLSVTWFRRQFLSKKRTIHLTFLHLMVCGIFLYYLTLQYLFCFARTVWLMFPIRSKHYISKLRRYFWSAFWSVQVSAPCIVMFQM
jgi:hypothetical protein